MGEGNTLPETPVALMQLLEEVRNLLNGIPERKSSPKRLNAPNASLLLWRITKPHRKKGERMLSRRQ